MKGETKKKRRSISREKENKRMKEIEEVFRQRWLVWRRRWIGKADGGGSAEEGGGGAEESEG